jgi:hypothetical protein
VTLTTTRFDSDYAIETFLCDHVATVDKYWPSARIS